MDKKKILSIAQIVLGVVALIMIFLPVLSAEAFGESITASGLQVIFGAEEPELVADFSFMGLVLLLLLVAIVCLPVVKFLKPDMGKILNIATIVCAVVAAILFFMIKSEMMINSDAAELYVEAYDLGIGAILGGIVALLSAAAACVDTFVLKD